MSVYCYGLETFAYWLMYFEVCDKVRILSKLLGRGTTNRVGMKIDQLLFMKLPTKLPSVLAYKQASSESDTWLFSPNYSNLK